MPQAIQTSTKNRGYAFPQEIKDHIVSHLFEYPWSPSFPYCGTWDSLEIDWDAFIQCGKPRLASRENGSSIETSLYVPKLDLKTLLSFRLVSHGWNVSATAVLRAHHWWPAKMHSESSLKGALNCCARTLANIPGQATDSNPPPTASLVKRLTIPAILDALTFLRWFDWDNRYDRYTTDEEVEGNPWKSLRPRTS